jgi:hypothetical protein
MLISEYKVKLSFWEFSSTQLEVQAAGQPAMMMG